MPRTSLRQVLEAIAATAPGITDEKDASALLDLHLGRVQGCNDTDALARLVKIRDGARKALDATFKVRTESMLARSHADPLVSALGPLERLIDRRMKEEPDEAPEASQAPAAEADDSEEQLAEFKRRLAALRDKMLAAKGMPGLDEAKLLASEAGVLAKKRDWTQAKARLDEAEQALAPADPQDAAALLDMHLGKIQACRPADALAALIKVMAGADKALQMTAKQALSSKLVASHQLVLAQALEAHAQQVDKRRKEAAAAVEAARLESANLVKDIQAKMTELTQAKVVDLAKLREQVKREFARAKDLDALLKQAAADGVPVTPSPAKVRFADNDAAGASEWTAALCEEAFKQYTWFEFKAHRKSQKDLTELPTLKRQTKVTDDVMWKLYQYRRHVIDGLIRQLHGEFPDAGLLFKSGGSEDIESDLDITVASSPPGADVQAMRRFNAEIKRMFGRPPGRVFDTNLYARDYSAIEDNLTQERDGEAPKDVGIAEPKGEMAKMANIDQDVATLMKQRRFLSEEAFTAMWQELHDSVTDPVDQKRIQQRFEEAESIYLLTAQEKVEAIEKKVEAKFEALRKTRELSANEAAAFKAFADQKQAFEAARDGHDLHAMQALLPEFLDLLEERFPDEVMDVTDDQYAERMARLREDQKRVSDAEAGHPQEGARCEELHPGKSHAAWANELNALKARIKQAQFTNIIFANEAYVSQGAIAHVVAGIQASTPEKKAAELKKITPEQLLQSANEQIADFFKDMKHMEHAETAAAPKSVERRRAAGEAFVHASKYLSRVLDAAAMLEEKYQGDDEAEEVIQALTVPPYELCGMVDGVRSPRELQARIDAQLVKLRKSSTIPGDAKAELAVDEVKTMFKVDSVDQLRQLIVKFSIEFNRRVRLLESFRAAQVVDKRTQKQYFQPAS